MKNMHYNIFTIRYIEAIQRNLNIVINENNETVYLPDTIADENIVALKTELESIWHKSESAIALIKNKHDSTLQSGLFGLINDLEKALKTGFLIGDRIILLDYLFDRIISRKEPQQVNRLQLGIIANNIVKLLPLAREGRIVIIPNPFIWNPDTKKIIKEVSETSLITPSLISMLNMLSICKKCNLHPYTIAESQDAYDVIINDQIDHVDVIGKDGGKFAYEGILGSLLSERLLNETEFSYIKDISIEKYAGIISQHKNFYSEYLSYITSGGSLNADNNIEKIRDDFVDNIKKRNIRTLKSVAMGVTAVSGIGSGTISLLGVTTAISAPLAIVGGILGLSASLSGLLNSNPTEENTIISLFNDLTNA
jgi:hypothetical protein